MGMNNSQFRYFCDGIHPQLFIFLCLALFGAWGWYGWGYVEDDAFIHIEFARNIAEAGEIKFKGLHVNGDSSPGWIFMLAGLLKIGFGFVWATKLLSALSLLGAASGLYFLALRQLNSVGLAQLFTLSIITSPFFLHWSFAGMEAILGLGMALWIVGLAFSEVNYSRYSWVVALLAGYLPLVRFELLPLGFFIGVYYLSGFGFINDKRFRYLLALITFAPFSIWAGYSILEFGSVIPTTNAAKHIYSNYSYFGALIRQFEVIFLGFGVPLLISILGLVKAFWRNHPDDLCLINVFKLFLGFSKRNRATMILLVYPLVCIAFYIVDKVAVQTRYVLLYMPLLLLGIYSLLVVFQQKKWIYTSVIGAMVASSMVFYLMVLPHVENKVRLVRNTSEFLARVQSAIPVDVPVAVYAIGQVGLYLPNPIIDIGGITMPEAISFINDSTKMLDWAWLKGARCFISGSEVSPIGDLVKVDVMDHPVVGWLFPKGKYNHVGSNKIWCDPKVLRLAQ